MQIKVVLHSGEEFLTETDVYNPTEIVAAINDPNNLVVVIGDVIAHRTSIKTVIANPQPGEV